MLELGVLHHHVLLEVHQVHGVDIGSSDVHLAHKFEFCFKIWPKTIIASHILHHHHVLLDDHHDVGIDQLHILIVLFLIIVSILKYKVKNMNYRGFTKICFKSDSSMALLFKKIS